MNNTKKENNGHVSAKNKVKMGIDAHLNNFSVCVIEENGNPKPAQKFNEVGFLKWVAKQCVEGVEVYTCYEAGPMGVELHRKLEGRRVSGVIFGFEDFCFSFL